MRLGTSLAATAEFPRPAKLAAFTAHLPEEWIERALQATGTATLRRRRLPAEQVVWLVLGERAMPIGPFWRGNPSAQALGRSPEPGAIRLRPYGSRGAALSRVNLEPLADEELEILHQPGFRHRRTVHAVRGPSVIVGFGPPSWPARGGGCRLDIN